MRTVDLAVALYAIRDKLVAETAVEARVVELAGERLRLRSVPEDETREWLAHITLPDGTQTGDIYLKTNTHEASITSGELDVFVTSILEADREALDNA